MHNKLSEIYRFLVIGIWWTMGSIILTCTSDNFIYRIYLAYYFVKRKIINPVEVIWSTCRNNWPYRPSNPYHWKSVDCIGRIIIIEPLCTIQITYYSKRIRKILKIHSKKKHTWEKYFMIQSKDKWSFELSNK